MALFNVLFLAAGLVFIYAGWLGVPPTKIVRSLFAGEALPARKPVLS